MDSNKRGNPWKALFVVLGLAVIECVIIIIMMKK